MESMKLWPTRSRITTDPPDLTVVDLTQLYEMATGEAWSDERAISATAAMKAAPVASGVNFLSNCIASLPLHFKRREARERDGEPEQIAREGGALDDVLNRYWNDDMDSYTGRKIMIQRQLLLGACYIYVNRNTSGRILSLRLLAPGTIKPRFNGAGVKEYVYSGNTASGKRRVQVFSTREVIEIVNRYADDGLKPVSFVQDAKKSIALYIAIDEYSQKFFGSGGIPPFALESPVTSEEGAKRMKKQVSEAIHKANKRGELVWALPWGHTVKNLGIDPEKSQVVESKRFQMEEIARHLGLPPLFLQDLTNGTYSNAEHQAIHVVKNRIRPLTMEIAQKFDLSLFGRGDDRHVEFELNDLLRGDMATRHNAWARAIQGGWMTPNEARAREGLPPSDQEGADKLHLQMGTQMLGGQNNESDNPEAGNPSNPPSPSEEMQEDEE